MKHVDGITNKVADALSHYYEYDTVAQKTAPMFHCFGKMDLLSNAVTSKKSEKIM
jgi:hypothetical protein